MVSGRGIFDLNLQDAVYTGNAGVGIDETGLFHRHYSLADP